MSLSQSLIKIRQMGSIATLTNLEEVGEERNDFGNDQGKYLVAIMRDLAFGRFHGGSSWNNLLDQYGLDNNNTFNQEHIDFILQLHID